MVCLGFNGRSFEDSFLGWFAKGRESFLMLVWSA